MPSFFTPCYCLMKTEPSQQSSKSTLRTELRQKRAALPDQARRGLDKAINHHLLGFVESVNADLIAAYMAFDGEPDLSPALATLRDQGKVIALPVISVEPGRATIHFRQWTEDCELRKNRYGILEPSGTDELHLPDVDLTLVPLVGWSASGARLGMGASFYDRLFQPFARFERPLRIGVGYGVQEVDDIPLEPWDIRMHGILSENGCERCS